MKTVNEHGRTEFLSILRLCLPRFHSLIRKLLIMALHHGVTYDRFSHLIILPVVCTHKIKETLRNFSRFTKKEHPGCRPRNQWIWISGNISFSFTYTLWYLLRIACIRAEHEPFLVSYKWRLSSRVFVFLCKIFVKFISVVP